MNSEPVKNTSIIGLVICFFKGHKKVYGHYTDGKQHWMVKCSRCNAVGNIKVETRIN